MSTPSASTPFSSIKKFNVTDIRSRISGVSYLSKFYFRLLPTIGIVEESKIGKILEKQKMEDIFIYANNVTVPQRAIDGENYTYSNGYRVNFPTTTSYGDGTIGINVRMDESYQLYDMFIQWMDIIHNKKTGHLSFYDDYVCDIEIFQLSYSNMNVFVSSGGGDSNAKSGRSAANSAIATYYQFQNIVEDLSNGSFRRTRGGTNNYSRFIIRNCYPKTISSIEFSHESQEKVNCLVNFAYEGIDYDVSQELEKTQESIIPSRETSSSNSNQAVSSITLANKDVIDSISPSPKSGRSTAQSTDSSGSKWSTEAIVKLSKVAKQAEDSLIYGSSIQEILGDNQPSFLFASAARNIMVAAQNHPSLDDGSGNQDLTGKYPTKEQKPPKVEVDPETGRVTNMKEILDAFNETTNDREYAAIISELGYDDIQVGIRRDVVDLINSRSNDDDALSDDELPETPLGTPSSLTPLDEDALTSYNTISSISMQTEMSIRSNIENEFDSDSATGSLILSTPITNTQQKRNELISAVTTRNIALAILNHTSVDGSGDSNLTAPAGRYFTSDELEKQVPAIEFDPITKEVKNSNAILDALYGIVDDPEYHSVVNNIKSSDIQKNVERDISVLVINDIEVPETVSVFPEPKHKELSVSHAVADTMVNLELEIVHRKDDLSERIIPGIDSNDSQISTLQSEINTLEASISGGGSSGNVGAIATQIEQKEALIDQIQEGTIPLMKEKIDNEKRIIELNERINNHIKIQNSNLSVDDQTRVRHNGQRVSIPSTTERYEMIDEVLDNDMPLPEEVQPTHIVAVSATYLNLEEVKIDGTPEQIEAAQTRYNSLLEPMTVTVENETVNDIVNNIDSILLNADTGTTDTNDELRRTEVLSKLKGKVSEDADWKEVIGQIVRGNPIPVNLGFEITDEEEEAVLRVLDKR